jgi:uncharacterized membrane protein
MQKSFLCQEKGFVIFANMKAFQDKDLQSFIGNLLRYGVIIALTIVVIGLVLYLFHSGHEMVHYDTFNANNKFVFATFWQRLLQGESSAIMELGAIALILIPIARVAFTMLGFWLEKDRLYTFIAFLVLCIIAFSMFFGVSTH